MSIITKPYEISVWEDSWDGESFTEKKICVIGSNLMDFGGRALNPTLTRNINGKKTFSFTMYKKFVDTSTGEEIENPFVKMLISERKVKLKYNGKWHDFLVKTITENSSKTENQYILEDANVCELSKNGFGLTLASELENNVGTAKELGEKILAGTGWTISEDSDKLIERIKEGLVYVQIPKNTKVTVIDSEKDSEKTFDSDTTVLAFTSSCYDKPQRFQFIYSPKGYGTNSSKLSRDEERIIDEKDAGIEYCYYDIKKPEDYKECNKEEEFPGLCLPDGWTLSAPASGDSQISTWYRGKKYGYSQKVKYVPQIDRYVYLYTKNKNSDEKTDIVYGYQRAKYCTPSIIQNYAAGSLFKSTSGWIGNGLSREIVVGRFGDTFITPEKDFQDNTSGQSYSSYLKVGKTPPDDFLLNSGPKDNRNKIGNMAPGSKWVVQIRAYNESGGKITFNENNISLGEFEYSSATWKELNNSKIKFSALSKEDNSFIFTVDSNSYSELDFKKNSKVYIQIKGINEPIYIDSIKFFEAKYANGTLIVPDDYSNYAAALEKGVATKTYVFFDPNKNENITSEDEIVPLSESTTLNYETYIPIYNDDAQKVRTLDIKESNYFNALQSEAEKFECWLDLDVGHSEDGAINSGEKKVRFKEYVGTTNNACFRYGLNLKDIKRTYESKNIVSKLIVKSNSNQFAENGFCTIQRAGANETGENYICDFQYYINAGLVSDEILKSIDESNAKLKNLNQKYLAASENYNMIAADLVSIKAKYEIAESGYQAATDEMARLSEQFNETYPDSGFTIEGPVNKNSETNGEVSAADTQEGDNKNKFFERDDVISLVRRYQLCKTEQKNYKDKKKELEGAKTTDEGKLEGFKETMKNTLESKQTEVNSFYKTYSRFLQEGTWVNEDYINDEKYYNDALSVLYNSCYPQVAYSINVIGLSSLPGYEMLDFDIGDQTHVIDPEFFGDSYQEEVVITELSENLDNPLLNSIKVQNFKNQFQDLFQKITATVQQTQYNTGAYNKAVAQSNLTPNQQCKVVETALNTATAKISAAGEQSVVWDSTGITVTDLESPANQIRLVGEGMLLSKQNEDTGETEWRTGITADGISADLVTAGRIDTEKIQIMNGNDRAFLWDKDGITAKADGGIVRFSKDGIYGIEGADESWTVPEEVEKIENQATFSLGWNGLTIKGKDSSKNDKVIVVEKVVQTVQNEKGEETKETSSTFVVSSKGDVEINGKVIADSGEIGGWIIEETGNEAVPKGALYHETTRTVKDENGECVKSTVIDAIIAPPQDTTSQDTTSQDTTSQDTTSQDTTSQDTTSQDTTSQDTTSQDTTSQNTTSQNTTSIVLGVGKKDGKFAFQVDSDGKLYPNGGISWDANSSPSQIVYHEKPAEGTQLQGPTDGTKYADFPDEKEDTEHNGWHKQKSDNDIYGSYTYDGGATWTNPIQIEAKDGSDATSPYLISLSNDFAVIGADENGGGINESTLKDLTTTTVSVYWGENQMTNCSYSWKVTPEGSGDLDNYNSETVHFENIYVDEALATVTVTIGDKKIGTKTFKVVKSKQGKSAISYLLSVSPNSFNKSTQGSVTPSFTVLKYVGDSVEKMEDGYTIKTKNGENYDEISESSPIEDTTTFYLFINDVLNWVDCETVEALENGQKGASGNTVSTVYAYRLSTGTTAPGLPDSDTVFQKDALDGWSFTETTEHQAKNFPYLWRSEGKKTVDADSKTTYSDWQAPMLYSACYVQSDDNINEKVNKYAYAEYLRTTNFNTDGLYVDADGKLYIAASYLSVKDKNDESVFYADGPSHTVTIGGASVTNEALIFGKDENQLCIKKDGSLTLYNDNFCISKTKDDGSAYVKGITMSNKDTGIRIGGGAPFVGIPPVEQGTKKSPPLVLGGSVVAQGKFVIFSNGAGLYQQGGDTLNLNIDKLETNINTALGKSSLGIDQNVTGIYFNAFESNSLSETEEEQVMIGYFTKTADKTYRAWASYSNGTAKTATWVSS